MEQSFLQRPGASQKMPAMQPLGGYTPATYNNTQPVITATRQLNLDNANRVLAQYQIDNGSYARAPVGPTNYERGNIMPSAEPTGPAGYNHQGKPVMPLRPADMTPKQYMIDTERQMNPAFIQGVHQMTAVPQQHFLNNVDMSSQMYPSNYQMPDNLTFPGAQANATDSK